DGRVLVLKSDVDHAWVDAYQGGTLRPLGKLVDKPGCGDWLFSSAIRIAIICESTGEIVLDDLRGNRAQIEGTLANLVAATMAGDGAVYLATADQHLSVVERGVTKRANVPWPSEWTGTVLPGGLGVAQGGAFVIVAERSDDAAWL